MQPNNSMHSILRWKTKHTLRKDIGRSIVCTENHNNDNKRMNVKWTKKLYEYVCKKRRGEWMLEAHMTNNNGMLDVYESV